MTTLRTPARIIPRAFPGIKPNEVQEIIVNSQIKSYPAETVLCQEDAIESTFYMILEGDFEVTKTINNTEKRLLKTLGAGDFFGEMALIHNAPRAATVKSLSSTVVLELSKEGFDRVLKHSPSVATAMVAEISNRLRQNDQLAIEDLQTGKETSPLQMQDALNAEQSVDCESSDQWVSITTINRDNFEANNMQVVTAQRGRSALGQGQAPRRQGCRRGGRCGGNVNTLHARRILRQ